LSALGAVEVLPERFLENHLTFWRKPRPVERSDRGREDGRRQREVHRDGAFIG
jgi:hypothetical protein